MSKITDIKASEILDSRGNPTLQAAIVLNNGIETYASVPSGASKGSHEAMELRDGGERFRGLGVINAVGNITDKIRPVICGFDPCEQQKIDKTLCDLDGTENKSHLGANSILAVSLAVCRAAADSLKLPLYKYISTLAGKDKNLRPVTPLFNVVNGGLHGSGKFNFQEFMIIPDPSVSFNKSLQIGVELYHQLKALLEKKGLNCSIGDEGGFTPDLSTNEEVLSLLKETVTMSEYKYASEVHLGLDLASSTFFHKNLFEAEKGGKSFRETDFIHYLINLREKFQLFSLEDPLPEDDWRNWQKLTQLIGSEALIIGDDLLVTNLSRLTKAIETKACNSILVKVNQIGSLSETLEVIAHAQKAGFKVIISHRSGETNDDFIADLAVGVGADFVKFGAPARGERVAKYNRLLEIYSEFVSW